VTLVTLVTFYLYFDLSKKKKKLIVASAGRTPSLVMGSPHRR